MDTDRDRDVYYVEVRQENKELVEEFMREKMGKRGKHANQEQSGISEDEAIPEAISPV